MTDQLPATAASGQAMSDQVMSDQVMARRDGQLGRITLNRPKSINALNLAMIRGVTRAVLRWWDDPEVRIVVLDGAGERGLCAGGDITLVR